MPDDTLKSLASYLNPEQGVIGIVKSRGSVWSHQYRASDVYTSRCSMAGHEISYFTWAHFAKIRLKRANLVFGGCLKNRKYFKKMAILALRLEICDNWVICGKMSQYLGLK